MADPHNKCAKCGKEVNGLYMVCEGTCGQFYHQECCNIDKNTYEKWKTSDFLRFICDSCHQKNNGVGTKVDLIEQFIYKIDEAIQKQSQKFSIFESEMRTIKEMMKNNSPKCTNSCHTPQKPLFSAILGSKQQKSNSKRNRSQSDLENEISTPKKKAPNPAIVVRAKEPQTSGQTKEKIKSQINPAMVSVISTKNVSNGGVILESESTEKLEHLKLTVEKALGESYVVDYAKLRLPEVKILHVNRRYTEDVIISNLRAQNLLDPSEPLNFIRMDEVTNRETQRQTFNIVLSASKCIYTQLLEMQKVSIGWQKCKIVENITIKTCFKCRGFNHIRTECSNSQACSKCSGEHDLKDCTSEESICINCVRSNSKFGLNIDIKHPSWSKTCPTYMNHIDNILKSRNRK